MKKNYSTNQELHQILIEFKSTLNLDEEDEKEYDIFIESLNLTGSKSNHDNFTNILKAIAGMGMSLKAVNEILKIIVEFFTSNTS